ncbi:MAG: 50S ribosomal protein L35ae [Candidatus Woesearchaeota archaeon]
MKARIVNFRRSKHVTSSNHMIVEVEGVSSMDKAKDFVGKSVSYDTGKSKINGKVASTHGNSGCIRVIFEKGMPGQAIGKEVSIN